MLDKFDAIYEERMKRTVKRRFNKVLADIKHTIPFMVREPIITRRRSTTLRNGDEFIDTATIRILD